MCCKGCEINKCILWLVLGNHFKCDKTFTILDKTFKQITRIQTTEQIMLSLFYLSFTCMLSVCFTFSPTIGHRIWNAMGHKSPLRVATSSWGIVRAPRVSHCNSWRHKNLPLSFLKHSISHLSTIVWQENVYIVYHMHVCLQWRRVNKYKNKVVL